jgi:hypothetical protein
VSSRWWILRIIYWILLVLFIQCNRNGERPRTWCFPSLRRPATRCGYSGLTKPRLGSAAQRRVQAGAPKNQIPMCSLRPLTHLQVQDLPRQGMVGPSSDSRLTKRKREDEANGPQGQRPARVSRGGPSWTEFVRLADQAVVAIAGTEMINRAEPRACGHSRGSRRLDTEPEAERTAGPASNAAGDGCGRAQDGQAGFQPYWLCGVFSYVAQGQETPVWRASDPLDAPHK